MRDLLRRALLENVLLKLVALALAVVLFVVVHGDRDALTSIYLKVVYLYPPGKVLVSEPVSEIRLTVRGPMRGIARLVDSDLEPMRVDLRNASDGALRFDPEMIHLPVGLHVATISPESVSLSFQSRVDKLVPVQPVVEGEPAAGFRLVRSSAQPRMVRVSGAKNVIDAISRVATLPVRVADARESVRTEVELVPPPPHAEWKLDRKVTVEIEVAQALAERVMKGLQIRVMGAERLDGVTEPGAADVVLRGPADALAQVGPGSPSLIVDAQAEDVRAPGVFRKRISVVGLPAGVAAEVRPESMTLVTRRRRD